MNTSSCDADRMVRRLIAEACGYRPESLTPHSALLDLGISSLTLVSVAAELEREACAELPESELQMLLASRTIADLATIAEQFLAHSVAARDLAEWNAVGA